MTDYQMQKYYLELISRNFFLSYAQNKEKNCYIQMTADFSLILKL